MRMRHIVICVPAASNIFFHIPSQTVRFSKKKFIDQKMRVFTFYTNFFWNISHFKKNWAIYNRKCISVFM